MAGGGIDTGTTAFDYTLTEAEIENLTRTGTARTGTGNSGANTITGLWARAGWQARAGRIC